MQDLALKPLERNLKQRDEGLYARAVNNHSFEVLRYFRIPNYFLKHHQHPSFLANLKIINSELPRFSMFRQEISLIFCHS